MLAITASLIGIILFLRMYAQEECWITLIKSRIHLEEKSGWCIPWSILHYGESYFVSASQELSPEGGGALTVFVEMSPVRGISVYPNDISEIKSETFPGWWITTYDLRVCRIGSKLPLDKQG